MNKVHVFFPWIALALGCGSPEIRPAGALPSTSGAPSAMASSTPASTPSALPKPASETVASASPRTTAGGSTFTVPAGWSIQTDAQRTILSGPEPDLRVAIVDAHNKSADDAIAAAWPAIHPKFDRPIKLSASRPGRHGWDEKRDYDYETSPNEKLVVWGGALRHADSWLALVVESGQASFEKRNAELSLIAESLRPKGYVKESFAGKTPHALDENRLKKITDFVEQGRVALGLPGVGISLVQNDKVIYEGGFGVRELGKAPRVDGSTMFMIASNSKALSTLLLAKEVDEGRFTWDTPATQVYPGFKLGSADTTSKVLMKHLVCACTGLPRQDMEWLFEYKKATPESVMNVLGTMQPTTKFGETFQYSNLMAAAAGFLGGYAAYPKKELGAAFDEAMKTRVFAPLGMTATTFDFGQAGARNHASAHGLDADGRMAIATTDINRSIISARPAGGAWSSASDLIKYVRMELAKGKLPSGKQFISETALLARRAPQVAVGKDKTYGMGLMVDNLYGTPIVHHGGDMIGFHSDMFWLPEHGVGGVILTNADGGWLIRRPFIRKVLEELFDAKPEAMEDVLASAKTRSAEIAKARERLVVPPAPDAVSRLAQRYKNDALGEVSVKAKGAARIFDFGEWRSAMASRKNDDGSTSMITVDPGIGGVDGFELVIADKNGKRMLILRDMQHEYEFVEVP